MNFSSILLIVVLCLLVVYIVLRVIDFFVKRKRSRAGKPDSSKNGKGDKLE